MSGDVSVGAEDAGLSVREGVEGTGEGGHLALPPHLDWVRQEVNLAGLRPGGDVAGPVISRDPPHLLQTELSAGLTDGGREAPEVS